MSTENLCLVEKPKDYKFYQYKLVGDEVVELKRFVALSFEVPDSDRKNQDVGLILHKWYISDQGRWIMENAFENPYFDYYKHCDRWTIQYKIVATFTAKKLTEYYLRFS